MEIIKGGVTAAKGFTASGMHVGLRRNVEKKGYRTYIFGYYVQCSRGIYSK